MHKLSELPKTWLIDIDGIIFEHNGYLKLKDGEFETPLPGVREFFEQIPLSHKIVLLTARSSKYRKITIDSLKHAKIRFDEILFDLPVGERILINDEKPDGMKTAFSINLKRNEGLLYLNQHISFSGD
ncbi:MAG: hypothetical protein N3E37_04625 [Candidatus Micrarchaeota archaeon]|nr:hypothetical protein [Candidatus Micrarchaeota archaeon]